MTSAMDERLKRCIALTDTGHVYVYPSVSKCTLTDAAKAKSVIFNDWNQFEEIMDRDSMVALIDRFGVNVERGMSKIDVCIAIWFAMIDQSTHNMVNFEPLVKKLPDGRAVKQGSKLAGRKYVLVDLTMHSPEWNQREQTYHTLPPQARTCIDLIKMQNKPEIGEIELRAVIAANADKLHTKQDPWRIFQYYRAILIQNKFMRLV